MANPAQHSDFGEKIGGAKKDLWQQRGLLSNDLNEMNSREADKYVRKDNIWKKADYQAMIDSGIPYDVVYFIKTVRDSLNATPQYYTSDDTPDKRLARQKQYIDTIREVQSVIENVRTKTDALRAYDNFFISNGYVERVSGISSSRYRATSKGQENPVITNKLAKALHISSEQDFEYKITRKAVKEQFGVSKEQKIPRGYEILFNDGNHSYSQNNDWLPNTYYVTKGHHILMMNLESREAALKWAQDGAAGVQTDGKKKRFIPKQFEHVQRDGPDYRHDRDVSGQDYLDTYGFKGGEFGNWMSHNDRQTSLNMGFDALKDLADVLKISDKDISYQGNLSIAFGARGSGNAVAHYEPMRQVINLTKMRGAGSLAHEWWHGLDDYMGQKLDVKCFLSENSHKHLLFQKLIDTIKYKPETQEQAVKRTEVQDTRLRRNAEGWLNSIVLSSIKSKADDQELKQYENLKAAYLRGERGSVDLLNDLKKSVTGRIIPKSEREKLLMFEGIIRSMDERKEPAIGRTHTEYYTNSKKMGEICEKDGGYWESNTEMTARAFSTYVMDKLPGKSDYLIGHAECAINITFDEDGTPHLLKAYPEGEERKAINAVFDEIVAELKLQHYLSHDERAQHEPEMVSPAVRENWQNNSFEQLTIDSMPQQQTSSTAQLPVAYNRMEFFRRGQGSDDGRLTLYEYSDRVELHRSDGIKKIIPAAGQTAKDIFISHMSELLNEGFVIKVMPPVANDLEDLAHMQDMLGIKAEYHFSPRIGHVEGKDEMKDDTEFIEAGQEEQDEYDDEI